MQDFTFDAIVIGAGHAGIEAGLALSRLNMKTLMLSISLDNVGYLACNPSIGGTAKGHLVREIDALGGEMGKAADKTTIQLRMLNSSKGFAVQSLRAQVDKYRYHQYMKSVLENEKNIQLRQGEAAAITKEPQSDSQTNGSDNEKKPDKDFPVYIVKTKHLTYRAKTVILCCGVYLKSKIIIGETVELKGPSSFSRAENFSQSLLDLGIELRRFKTGTPARVKRDSIDLKQLELQQGERLPYSFCALSKNINYNAAQCYLGYTNAQTHDLIRENLSRTARKLGLVDGTGARYCPSIEDKIERFKKDRHPFFLEPEGLDTQEMYVQGISTSLPAEIQLPVYRSIKGFEKAEIMRDAYAIEYDCIDPTCLDASLRHKAHSGLFFAGQINGTSGYEEAAAQGLIAGINAARYLKREQPFILTRDNSYIGVMIDDLITKGTDEPYRMMTSRSEYRLYLRQDNADLRLTAAGRQAGLVEDKRYKLYLKKLKDIKKVESLLNTTIALDDVKSVLTIINCHPEPAKDPSHGAGEEGIPHCVQNDSGEKNAYHEINDDQPLTAMTLERLMRRHNAFLEKIFGLSILKNISKSAITEVYINLRYSGYLSREERSRREQARLEQILLPQNIDYSTISGLRIEAAEKLNKVKPRSIAQAGRISGVNPADVNVLLVRLKQGNRD